MKKLFIFIIMVFVLCLYSADTALTGLDDLGANAAAADKLHIYDNSASYDKRIDLDDFFTSIWAMNQAFTLYLSQQKKPEPPPREELFPPGKSSPFDDCPF